MNINGVAAQSSGLLNVNRGLDNTQRGAGDIQGTGRPEESETRSGLDAATAVREAAVDPTTAGASTQVVNDAEEVLGNLIDTRA
ncbi:hypothetical protein [Nitrincola alkalilacustris]|uniref:hypothetical protein n=1 Tax=Nitrincola alkalilacustris TaxID=1571224 RepID=UPI00124E503C|nr:hypothetical protein [Nitrincola alkalilacustris]